MRILWFTGSPSCYLPIGNNADSGYNGGGWISSAELSIRNIEGVDLGIAFFMDQQPNKVIQNGVSYYPIPSYVSTWKGRFQSIFNLCFKSVKEMCNSSAGYFLSAFSNIINDFKPDIIHIWGSEAPFGLIYAGTTIPIILHIQGIIIPYNNAYLPPFVSYKSYANNSLSLKYRLNKYVEQLRWKCLVYREKMILGGINNYLGRTDWDRRVTHILNPNSNYYHVDEILRDTFYLPANRIIPKNLIIVTTISQPLYKGFDLVLKTANLLKNQLGLDFEWICYGNINPLFIEKVVGITHEQVNITLKGVASAEQLRDAEICATLYFHSSYIDNSPNSICEAQMLGLPIVSTNVGGIPSLVEHGVDGFLFPSNDPYQAAYFIEKLFLNPDLNNQMGEKGKQKAVCRHDRNRVREQILNVYKSITN